MAVAAAVAKGLRRVLVLPLGADYWQWQPETGLLLVAERSRDNPAVYRRALRAAVSP